MSLLCSIKRSLGLARLQMLALAIACVAMTATSARADIINVNLLGVEQQYRPVFLQAEAFWESRIQDWSPLLPKYVRSQLHDLEIVASTPAIDGVGGILGQAAPTEIYRYRQRIGGKGAVTGPIAIAQAGTMEFDIDDIAGELASGTLFFTVAHEMAHVMGFGTLWADNGLLANLGGFTYHGKYGLEQYRMETGNQFAPFVPVENLGGPGTAGGHWDSQEPFFFDPITGLGETMIGFSTPNPFFSNATWGSLEDVWFDVQGIGEDGSGTGDGDGAVNGPKTSPAGGGGTSNLMSAPEPTTFSILAIAGVAGLAFRRRRK